ncbi:MAG: hypothetical protein ACKVP2_11880 [Burkholderiales bacterium]
MGKKKKSEDKEQIRKKKNKPSLRPPIEDALAYPPASRFFWELVVGNGIGETAVEDALEAYRRALESRREKALRAAQTDENDHDAHCASDDHLIYGPFVSQQIWRISREAPLRATCWSWVGYQSLHFFRTR